MNIFSKIRKSPHTDESVQQELAAMQIIFDSGWRDALGCMVDLAMYRHFGGNIELSKELQGRAVELAIQHANTDWSWFRVIMPGSLVVLLFGQDEDIEQFCNKFTIEADPGMTTPLEYQVPQIYLLVCNELKTNRQPSENLETNIAGCRKKNPIEYLKVFRAAVSGSQAEYEVALLTGIEHYRGLKEIYLDAVISMYISKELSAINLMAMRLGKTMPDLPVESAACILTRKSVLTPRMD